MNKPIDFLIEDVQNLPDSRSLVINKVGIKSLRHPIQVHDRSGRVQHAVATFNMSVLLPENLKGTHMSRFVEMINNNDQPFAISRFDQILKDMLTKLDAESGKLEMSFTYFVKKSAPVSGVESLMDYEVTLIGKVDNNGESKVTLKVLIPVTSLCPCSKKISNYGAHNQRSHVTVNAELIDEMHIEEIIDLVETQASSQLYALLKRPDEKYVTELAYDNPKFVEDMVRDIAGKLNKEMRIGSYVLECENFESIHNHSAYAVICANK